MFEGEDIAFSGLEVCSYRHLQGVAKKMGLPSNVKKVHLIEMIRAKKYCTETDLKMIVDRVKMERKVNAQAKKKKQKRKPFRLQGTEVSSTSTSRSPPTTQTPKPSDFVIQYSPDIAQTIMKYQPRPNILRPSIHPLKQNNDSDRVLRSFNAMKRPNYRIMEQSNCVFDVVKAQNAVQELHQERVHEIRQESAYRRVNVTIQKHRPVMNAIVMNKDRQMVPLSRSVNTGPKLKRQRKLSGIYPIEPSEKPYYEYIPSVGLRQADGRVTKINAVIQRPLASTLLPKNHSFAKNRALAPKNHALNRPIVVTVQDVINYKVDHPAIKLTDQRALESSSSRLYDDQTNEVDRQIYAFQTDQSKQFDQQVFERQSNEIDRRIYNYQTKTDARAIEPCTKNQDYQVFGHKEPMSERDQNLSRKVYKNRQISAKIDTKGWNYNMGYQENEIDTRKEWSIFNIDGQLLDKSNPNYPYESQCFSHKVKQASETISSNYKVKQGRITEPVTRNYPSENQQFDKVMSGRNIEHARKVDLSRNMIHARNIDNARNTVHAGYVDHARIDSSKNTDFARNTTHASDIEHSRNTIDAVNVDHSKNIDYTRNTIHARNLDQERNIDCARNMNQARNSVRTRNLDHSTSTDTNASQYPNMAALTDVFPNTDFTEEPIDNTSDYSVYYHKKIREQVRTYGRDCEGLPKINEAFSQFNDIMYRNLNQPLYVQVSKESERVPMLMHVNNINSTCMLESLYNFKNQFVTNPPVLQIATTQTQCTYSTKTVATAVAQPAATDFCNNTNSFERATSYHPADVGDMPRLYGYLKENPRSNFECDEVLSSSTASLETANSQDLGANVTIPEMVEDALELISQDGDYMERIGMDVRVQCIICEWAGPKIILEYHIKQEHSQSIQQQDSNEWSVQLTLGGLISKQTWSSYIIQHSDILYAVSVKYSTTDVILVCLSMISTDIEERKRGRITVYNKISGKPFTFEGIIKHIPDSMPYEYGLECLVLDVGSLDLIPNSANLKLVNRELVGTPARVVVGQLELDRVEIVVYVNVLD